MAERRLRAIHRGSQRGSAGAPAERSPTRPRMMPNPRRDLAWVELVQCATCELTEALRIDVVEGDADDAAARDESDVSEMKQPREELAPGKIAGGAHQNHDLRISRTYSRRYLSHPAPPFALTLNRGDRIAGRRHRFHGHTGGLPPRTASGAAPAPLRQTITR